LWCNQLLFVLLLIVPQLCDVLQGLLCRLVVLAAATAYMIHDHVIDLLLPSASHCLAGCVAVCCAALSRLWCNQLLCVLLCTAAL
jgi:hypothetical protein